MTSCSRQEINAISRDEAQGGRLGDNWMQYARHDIEMQRGMISCTFNPRDFTGRLKSAVNTTATAYREDVDQWNDERKAPSTILNLSSLDDPIVVKYMEERRASSIISNDRHSIATAGPPEELARLWNIGLQTSKDTARVTTQ
jgi:hypothetical protein